MINQKNQKKKPTKFKCSFINKNKITKILNSVENSNWKIPGQMVKHIAQTHQTNE